ncbi:MAG: symmetrical bis(5'-nucleosyl)-tetraphosphatase [Pseudomonadota bacterium]
MSNELKQTVKMSPDEMEEELFRLKKKIENFNDVNLSAIKEYEQHKIRFDFLSKQRDDLVKAVEDLQKVIRKIDRITQDRFMNTLNLVNEKLCEVFPRLFEGGTAKLVLSQPDNPLETGVEFMIHPPGKKLTRMSLLSGGEKALSAIAFIFSLFLMKPTSFCLLDEIDEVLPADRDELLSWLRHRPLLHYDEEFCLIHAGLSPHWDLDLAMRCASEVQGVLQGPDHGIFLDHMYGDTPHGWDESLEGWDRLRFIINCFTRMRYCDEGGRLDLKEKGPPGSQPKHLMPWFEAPNRKSTGTAIVFGHWSTLGFSSVNSCYGLDTGCLWGGQLTALRLDGEMFRTSIACPGAQAPGL